MRWRVLGGAFAALVIAVACVWVAQSRRARRADEFLAKVDGILAEGVRNTPAIEDLDVPRALALIGEARSLGAGGPRFRLLVGEVQALSDYKRGALVLAARLVERTASENHWTPFLHVLAGEIARDRGEAPSALLHARAALELDRGSGRALILLADLALDQGDGTTALEKLRALETTLAGAQASPPWLLNRMGLSEQRLGRSRAAEALFREAIAYPSEDASPAINLGHLLRAEDRLAEAVESYDLALVRAPTDSSVLVGRGLAKVSLGLLDEAESDLDRAVEIDPTNATALLARGDLHRRGRDVAAAVPLYRRAVQEDDKNPVAWLRLGNALLEQRETIDALRAFETAIARDPNLAAAFNGLGAAKMLAGDASGARAALSHASELDPSDPNPLLNLAILDRRAHGPG